MCKNIFNFIVPLLQSRFPITAILYEFRILNIKKISYIKLSKVIQQTDDEFSYWISIDATLKSVALNPTTLNTLGVCDAM